MKSAIVFEIIMKSYDGLWNKFITYNNLYLAYKNARKVNPNSSVVLNFSFNLETNLLRIQNELITGHYEVSKYNIFTIYEPKERIIKSLPFKDRIVQHALINIIEPIFEKVFIYNSFACRKKKGINLAFKKLKKLVQSNNYPKYFLKSDVKKYFFSVDKKILKHIISKRIKDTKLLFLIFKIIDSDNSNISNNKGIPIGNLTSQLFANIYLNELDQFVKHNLHIKHYFRYMDDFLFFSNSKNQLNKYSHYIRNFMKCKLKLKLPKKKTNICLTKDGVDFVGYKIFHEYVQIRKTSLIRFTKRTKHKIFLFNNNKITNTQLESSICSFLGFCKYADSYRIINKIFDLNFNDYKYLFYKIFIK